MTDGWDQSELNADTWDSVPFCPTPAMQHPAHAVTTEVPPGYDGTTSWLKYSDALEEWCDLTKVEAKRRDPAIAARLSGRAECFKEKLTGDRLEDPQTGVEYRLSTPRPYFVKDGQFVFLYSFSRCFVATAASLIFSAGW